MPINAKHFPPLLRLSLTVVAGACLALPTLLGQEKPANPPQKASPTVAEGTTNSNIDPDDSAYADIQAEFREHLKKMRETQVRYHLSEDNSNDKKFRRQWAELCDQGRPLAAKAHAAMLKKFTDNPDSNIILATFLVDLLERNVSDSRFEGMLDLALALESNGITNEKIPKASERITEAIALSAIAENKFDLAKPWIEKHYKESTKPRPVLGSFYEKIDDLNQAWAEELRLREEDAKGEPLPQVSILTTKGEVIVELFENQAPETVANFIHLVEEGFFDGLTFHRVLEHFMAQTGCPEGDGSGGPGYSIYGETQKPNARKYFRGTLGMALSNGDANSGGSQFFICFLPVYNLNGQYTAFGRVVKGIEVIGNIAQINPEEKKKEGAAPIVLDEVIEAKVVRKRNHEYKPNKVVGSTSSTLPPPSKSKSSKH